MKAKHTPTLRPKHALWLVVAVLVSTWYITDPQARSGSGAAGDRRASLKLQSTHPATGGAGRVVVSSQP
jgi:hypothetical protein